MKIKATYFLKCIPGIPVFETMTGELMLPFSNKKTGTTFWAGKNEFQGSESDIKNITSAFKRAKEEIDKIRIQELSRKTIALA